MIVATLSYKFGFNMWRITMENRESESELNECKKKLNKAHQTIEELKIKMTQDKKNHKWEIREINKRIEQATDKNLELYDRESKALIYADQLEKDKNILVKEKREHEKKIEKLERENEQLKEELAKITERKNFSNDPQWKALKSAGKQKAHS